MFYALEKIWIVINDKDFRHRELQSKSVQKVVEVQAPFQEIIEGQ